MERSTSQECRRRRRVTGRLTAVAALLAAGACADAPGADESVAAVEYWAQPDTVVIGLGNPTDVKPLSRDRVFIADRAAAAIFRIDPRDSSYVGIGMGELEPLQVELPLKLAVSRDIGLAAFDGKREAIDLLSLDGDYIRSFEPGFVPAVMAFGAQPVGFTFGIAPTDSAGVRRSVVLRTGLRGEDPDTLLSPRHGPEALRGAVARPGETMMAPSARGMWVWSRVRADSVFEVTSRDETRAVEIRPEDRSGDVMLFDIPADILWIAHSDSTGSSRYSAYDVRTRSYLGSRTIEEIVRPAAVYDGILMAFRRVKDGIGMIAYDMRLERFDRTPGDNP